MEKCPKSEFNEKYFGENYFIKMGNKKFETISLRNNYNSIFY
jgi:hypothetical protein